MRALLTCLCIIFAGSAQAMNWEGHDDWMAELSPAHDFQAAVPEARPRAQPSAICSTPSSETKANPYEQIPLTRPHCRAPAEERELRR